MRVINGVFRWIAYLLIATALFGEVVSVGAVAAAFVGPADERLSTLGTAVGAWGGAFADVLIAIGFLAISRAGWGRPTG